MSLGTSGLGIVAKDINGEVIRGNHHQTVVEYSVVVTQSGEVLQSWKTALHPDNQKESKPETEEQKFKNAQKAQVETDKMNE